MKKMSFLVLPLLFLSFFKISFAAGSFKFFFTGINFLTPLFGFLLQSPIGTIFFPVIWFFKMSKCITFGVPTILSALCWAYYNSESLSGKTADFILRFLIPLISIMIFVFNTSDSFDFLYSFYWFIPVLIYLFQKTGKLNSIFYFALSVSFVAHATGSIIWFYAIPMVAGQWLGLIPVVFFERFIVAVGTALTYLFIKDLNFYFNFLSFKKIGLLKDRIFSVR
ncbi:MAG: hypothetical protein ABIA74_01560 [bacterium]